MRKLSSRIALHGFLLMLLALAPAARAQDEERPGFKMPCEEVLRLGLDKFMDVYGEKTGDYSTAGQKQGFEYWANCKRPDNNALAARSLSEERSKQVEAAREEFNKFGTALWGLRYLEEGGGTMWGLVSVGSYAEREKFMETFIRTLAAPERRSPRARRRANASLARIQRLLSAADRKPFTEGSEPEQVEQNKKYYEETIKETQDALAKLRDLLKELPDAAAERLATKMATETQDALADTP
ncbi:MAG TPA: hypothetical protein VN256_24115 [Pyrinomonadaceae bacterium]|nr:hypothetical protein [Pyrinomonadaceae bacterium]